MAEDFISSLIKKALMASASSFGSKVGGAAASFVLDLLGISDNAELDEIKSELDSISSQVQKLDDKVSDLIKEVDWTTATAGFDQFQARIDTYSQNLQKYLAIQDKTQRDKQITHYVLTDQPSFAELDTYLTYVDRRIMGTSGFGSYNQPLMKTFIDTHWQKVWDKNPATAYYKLLAVYLQAVQMQRLATALLIAYRKANGEQLLADAAGQRLTTRLRAQFRVFANAGPAFVMLNQLASPGVEGTFSSLGIAPFPVVGTDRDVLSGQAPVTPPNWWTLKRIGADPKSANYELWCQPAGSHGSSVAALSPQETISPLITLRRIQMVDPDSQPFFKFDSQGRVVSLDRLTFLVECTDSPKLLRLKAFLGSSSNPFELAVIHNTDFGDVIEVNTGIALATAANGLVTCSAIATKPVAGRPTLSAYSRDFASRASGEGRFKPGFRVRYRVCHINRFGDSANSDWLAAPRPEENQDSEGYFGHARYYFPQLALAADPQGRTEAYRIFRQFHGDVEEDVTEQGTFTGDPATGKTVVFDDFKP